MTELARYLYFVGRNTLLSNVERRVAVALAPLFFTAWEGEAHPGPRSIHATWVAARGAVCRYNHADKAILGLVAGNVLRKLPTKSHPAFGYARLYDLLPDSEWAWLPGVYETVTEEWVSMTDARAAWGSVTRARLVPTLLPIVAHAEKTATPHPWDREFEKWLGLAVALQARFSKQHLVDAISAVVAQPDVLGILTPYNMRANLNALVLRGRRARAAQGR